MVNQAPAPDATMLSNVIANVARREGPGVYGITGPAGAGKSYAAKRVAEELRCSVYSADFAFIGSSSERKMLLSKKQMRSIDAYKDAANQFNWWDWGTILSDLEDLQSGRDVEIEAPYDRTTGELGGAVTISATDTLVYEGAIFGPPFLATRLKQIFFLWVDPAVRFQRLLEKDQGRRSFNEILARFLITEYSETLYYGKLLQWVGDKVIFIDGLTGLPRGRPELSPDLFIPLHVPTPPPV
jgi:cytidylate kinase